MRTVHTHTHTHRCISMLNTSKRRNGKKERKHKHANCTYTKHIHDIQRYTQRCDAMKMMDILLVYRCSTYTTLKAFHIEWKMVQFLLVREKRENVLVVHRLFACSLDINSSLAALVLLLFLLMLFQT